MFAFAKNSKLEYGKILWSRLLFALTWTIILQIFPLSLYVFLTNIDIMHPVSWIMGSSMIVFCLETWFTLTPIHILLLLLGLIILQEQKQPFNLITSRFKEICSFFKKNNLLRCFVYTILGITLPLVYFTFSGTSITEKCQSAPKFTCLNDKSVFLIACGVWTGFYYFIKFDLLTKKFLQFPIIKQLRFIEIKTKYPGTFKKCLKLSILPVIFYLIFYLWYGKQVISLFEFIISVNSESSALTTLSGLLNFYVIGNAWLICAVYFILIETLNLMIEIHFTEHYQWALIPHQSNSKALLLSSALGESSVPIIQSLACYDLFLISRSQKSVRWQVFTLSQPGGHPHTWNAILNQSLKLIDNFISEIEKICALPEPVKPPPPVPRHLHTRDMTMRHEEIISGPVPLSPASKLRNLSGYPHRAVIKQEGSAIDELWIKINLYLNVIKQNSVINYIFGTQPDAKIRHLCSNSQSVIWLIQSISELAANALMEDQFGIVLKDLPIIINTLLRLKFSLEKLGTFQRKLQKRDHDLCMKKSLKSALKISLYRIAIAYSDYLTDLPLSPENLNSMQSFVRFKEC